MEGVTVILPFVAPGQVVLTVVDEAVSPVPAATVRLDVPEQLLASVKTTV